MNGTGVPPGRARDDTTISLLGLVNVLLRYRRWLVVLPAIAAVAAVALGLLSERRYTTELSFVPETGQGQGARLATVAAQFGLDVGGATGGTRPLDFYGDLVTTRELLRKAVVSDYRLDSTRARPPVLEGTLVEIFEIETDRPDVARALAIESLRGLIRSRIDAESGTVELSVTTRHPELSHQIGQRLVDLVNEFNLETRQSQAEAERRFLEERVEQARADLVAAEDSLERFLERNRQYQNSPQLRFEHDRLQRRVRLQEQIFTSLSQSLEQAKIEEVRNTPVITVVDPPERPARPDSRRLVVRGLVGVVLGGLLAVLWGFGREFFGEVRREEPDEWEEYTRLRQELYRDLGTVWRKLMPPFLRRRGDEGPRE